MYFMATVPVSAMVAGIERSTLPGPRVTTNIWPSPTRTEKVAKERAAVTTSPAPCPPVKISMASQTATVATKDQIQGLRISRVTAAGMTMGGISSPAPRG